VAIGKPQTNIRSYGLREDCGGSLANAVSIKRVNSRNVDDPETAETQAVVMLPAESGQSQNCKNNRFGWSKRLVSAFPL